MALPTINRERTERNRHRAAAEQGIVLREHIAIVGSTKLSQTSGMVMRIPHDPEAIGINIFTVVVILNQGGQRMTNVVQCPSSFWKARKPQEILYV